MSDDIRINNDNSVLTVIRSAICWENETRKGKQKGTKDMRGEEREREREKLSGEKDKSTSPSVILNAVASSRERGRRDGKSSAARLSIAGRHVDSGGPIQVISAFIKWFRELRY